MDSLTVSKKIIEKIHELDALKSVYKDALVNKVNAQVEYDKTLAIEIVKLRAYTPVSIVDKLAKGNISETLMAVELAEANVKAIESNIRSALAQLNAYQSINKYFAEM